MEELPIKVPAIEKLLDYTASGIGAIAGPMLAPWRASREGKARITAAHADAEVRLIEAESESGTSAIIAKARLEARDYLLTPESEVRGTVEFSRDDIIQRIEFQERKRMANIRSVVEDAADELGDKEVADHEPDPDWTARFINDVQDVSSEDLRKIWAKVLAGEVESPGRTSLRTLDTLRNMTKRDAEMFRDVCNFVLNKDFVFYHASVKDLVSLNYNTLLHLQDCGLINVGPTLVKQFVWRSSAEAFLIYHDRVLVITKGPGTKDMLKVPEVLLTAPGRELSYFARGEVQMKYLQAFSEFLRSEDCRLEYLEGVVEMPDGRIQYANRIPIEPQSEEVEGPTP